MPHDYDVVIAGAGMVGASLACALASTGLRIGIVESVQLDNQQQSSYDERGITLSAASKRILGHLDVWSKLAARATPIKAIHVSEQGRFGFTHIDANDIGLTELGHVVVARELGRVLHDQMLSFENVQLYCPSTLKGFRRHETQMQIDLSDENNVSQQLTAALLIGADGSHSLVRRLAGISVVERDFRQTAIVANIATQRPNRATAFERFTRHGPIALLPIAEKRSVLVFTAAQEHAAHYLSMSKQDYIQAVGLELGRRLGRIEQLGSRRSYPIKFMQATKQIQSNLVLLGNSLHTLHPNAAQGFNLGLRDVAGLSECIHLGVKKGQRPDNESVLNSYLALRQSDQQRVVRLTNGLADTFYNRLPLVSVCRNLAMLGLDLLPALKNNFARVAMGLSGLQPSVVRD